MANDRTVALALSIYNPGSLKKEDLIRGFVARKEVLDWLLGDLRSEDATGRRSISC
jgi:hypothetical protein